MSVLSDENRMDWPAALHEVRRPISDSSVEPVQRAIGSFVLCQQTNTASEQTHDTLQVISEVSTRAIRERPSSIDIQLLSGLVVGKKECV